MDSKQDLKCQSVTSFLVDPYKMENDQFWTLWIEKAFIAYSWGKTEKAK